MKAALRPRTAFLTGLLIILPLVITLWLLSFLFGPIQRFATPQAVALLRWIGLGGLLEAPGAGVVTTAVGLVLTAILVYLVGVFGSNLIGKRIFRALDRLVLRIPLVKGIYGSARQLLDTFSDSSRLAFRQVVLIEYPRRGCYTVGFVTSVTAGEPQARTAQRLVNVFVPTTPNPTSGMLVMVTQEDLIPMAMTVEEAIRLVVSGGIVAPPARTEAAPKPLVETAPDRT